MKIEFLSGTNESVILCVDSEVDSKSLLKLFKYIEIENEYAYKKFCQTYNLVCYPKIILDNFVALSSRKALDNFKELLEKTSK